eukprot:Nk52_evm2s553 gene=Nk52_evmTU2s553
MEEEGAEEVSNPPATTDAGPTETGSAEVGTQEEPASVSGENGGIEKASVAEDANEEAAGGEIGDQEGKENDTGKENEPSQKEKVNETAPEGNKLAEQDKVPKEEGSQNSIRDYPSGDFVDYEESFNERGDLYFVEMTVKIETVLVKPPEEVVELVEEVKEAETKNKSKKGKKGKTGKTGTAGKGDGSKDSKGQKDSKTKKDSTKKSKTFKKEEELKKRQEERRKEEQIERRKKDQAPPCRFFYTFNLFLEDNPVTTVTTDHILEEQQKPYEYSFTLCVDENILMSYYNRRFEVKIFDDLSALLAKLNRFRKGAGGSKDRTQGRRRVKEEVNTDPIYVNSIYLNLKPLFMGELEVEGYINTGISQINTLEFVKVTLSLNQPLMSPTFYEKLNPLILTITKADNMPDRPVSYDELGERCEPAYCKYSLFNEPEANQTVGRAQGKTLKWEEKRVYLTGFWDKDELREFLRTSELVVELHDRDRKIDNEAKPLIFGSEEERLLPDINEVPDRKVPNNPFSSTDKPFDPYGVCKFKLNRLLDGERRLSLTANVLPCDRPDHWNIPEVDFMDQLPAGSYVGNGSTLTIKLDLAYPLNLSSESDNSRTFLGEASYLKIIYTFEYTNTRFLRFLEKSISDINIEALGLTDLPAKVTSAALSTYRLSRRQRASSHLNIITGFQVMDANARCFVLEGLQSGITRLWSSIQLSENDRKTIKCLYNSEVKFPTRNYLSFDVEIKKVKLYDALDNLVKEPMLYLKGAVPEECLEGVLCLQEIKRASRLYDLVKYNKLPTADMIVGVARKYGINLTKDDFYGVLDDNDENESEYSRGFILKSLDDPVLTGNTNYESQHLKPAGGGRRTSQYAHVKPRINCYDPEFDFFLENRKTHIPNFVETNIARFGRLKPIKHRNLQSPEEAQGDEEEVYSYSIQKLNCTMQERERMRREIAKDKSHLYTYNPLYQTLTFSTVDEAQVHKEEALASKRKWMTKKGFVVRERKNSIESNRHPKFDCISDTAEPAHTKVSQRWVVHTSNTVKNLSPSTNPHDYFGTGAPHIPKTSNYYSMQSQILGQEPNQVKELTEQERLDILWSKSYMPSEAMWDCLKVPQEVEKRA